MSDSNKRQVVQLGLSEKEPNSSPGLVQQMLVDLREALPGLFTDLSDSGRTWLGGKSAQEAAKAQQILSDVIDRIGRLQLDEREQQHRHAIETEKHSVELEQKRMELYLSSLESAVRIVKEMADMGFEVDITAILSGIPVHIEAINLEAANTNTAPAHDA